jgi:hypothetical protein
MSADASSSRACSRSKAAPKPAPALPKAAVVQRKPAAAPRNLALAETASKDLNDFLDLSGFELKDFKYEPLFHALSVDECVVSHVFETGLAQVIWDQNW